MFDEKFFWSEGFQIIVEPPMVDLYIQKYLAEVQALGICTIEYLGYGPGPDGKGIGLSFSVSGDDDEKKGVTMFLLGGLAQVVNTFLKNIYAGAAFSAN